MIDPEQEVEITLTSNTIKTYTDLNYNLDKHRNKRGRVKKDSKLFVKLKDIPLTSRAVIECCCDYCNKIYKIKYVLRNMYFEKSIIKKDQCLDCKSKNKKRNESNLVKYGVEVHNKVNITIQEIYQLFKLKGLLLLSTEFIGNKEKLEYRCENIQNIHSL